MAPSTGEGAPPAVPDKEKGSSLLPSLRLQSLDELLVGAVLKAGPTGTSVQGNKEALSLQTTSVNFRRFVQKSGPIFVAQDAVEGVVRWEDPAKTSFYAAAWAILCYWPALVVLIPNVVLVSILLTTYRARKYTNGPPPEDKDGPTPLAKDPPTEGSVDYFANLQNIQIMMGRVADLTDVLRSFVPYLTWRDERLTRSLFLFSVLSSFLLASVARFIPWRFVFFVLGESTLLLGHPLVQTFLADAKPRVWTNERRKRALMTWTKLIEDDELRDDELDCEVVEVQRIEVESRIGMPPASSTGGGNGSSSLSPSPSMSSLSDSPNPNAGSTGGGASSTSEIWQPEAVVGGDLPAGFRWLSSHWQDVPPPADGAIDTEGWTYIFLDGSRSNGPSKVVVAMNPAEKDKVVWAQTRRRRLTRRAIKNPLLGI